VSERRIGEALRGPALVASLAAWGGMAGCREAELRDAGPGGSASATGSAAPRGVAVARTPGRVMYPGAPGSFVDLVSAARHGVVAIRAATPVKSGPAAMFPGAPEATADIALGTGFAIDASGVFILTNDHIAAAASDLRVVLSDHRDLPASLVGRDPVLDLALLSIGQLADPPRPLALGDSDGLQVGEWLIALGDAFGDEVTASVGVVSATGRDAAGSLVAGRAMGFRTFVQTDARIHRGNSGGPVLDTAGEVVGVAVATGDRPGELSFAIPINRVREVIASMRDHGEVARSWLGIVVQPVTAELAQTTGLARPSGALIAEVKPDSPAARAGLRAGDIVTAWGEREVDQRSLPGIVAQAAAHRPVNATVWRGRNRLVIAVVPDALPR
jgi:serine protease Do